MPAKEQNYEPHEKPLDLHRAMQEDYRKRVLALGGDAQTAALLFQLISLDLQIAETQGDFSWQLPPRDPKIEEFQK